MKFKTILAGVVALGLSATATFAASMNYYATTAEKDPVYGKFSGGHSMVVGGTKYQFDPAGLFSISGSTASLTGEVSNGGAGFKVNLNFESAKGKAKRELKKKAYVEHSTPGPIDPSTWQFWQMIETGSLTSTLIGTGTNEGLAFNVLTKPRPNSPYKFQSGVGANGKNLNMGLSGWIYLESIGERKSSLCSERARQTCDFNIDLISAPLPASSLLLIGGLAGLGAMRRRQKAA